MRIIDIPVFSAILIRPFFCQVEDIETAIWLTEVASGPLDNWSKENY